MHRPLPAESLSGEGLPSQDNLVACPDCDLLQRIPALPAGGAARCPRCSRTMAVGIPDSQDRVLALTVAAAIVLIIANVTPLMGLSAVGRQASTTIGGGVLGMWLHGEEITALLMAFCTVVAPTAYIGLMLAILLAVRRPPAPSWTGTLLRILKFNQPWTMFEVMMLGILIALKKIADLATVIPGTGMYAVGTLIVLIAVITVRFDPHAVWIRIRWAAGDAARSPASSESADEGRAGS